MQPLQLIAAIVGAAAILLIAVAESEEAFGGDNHISKQEEAFERLLARAMANREELKGVFHKDAKRPDDNTMAFWKRADEPAFWQESNFWKRSGSPAMFWKRGGENARLFGAFRKYLSGNPGKRFGDMMASAPKDIQRRQEDLSRPEFNPTGW